MADSSSSSKGDQLSCRSLLAEALLILMMITVIVYLLMRSVFIVFAALPPLEKTLAVLFLLAEAFVMLQAIGFFTSVYKLSRVAKLPPQPTMDDLDDHPSVAILVPARHEPYKVLDKTFLCLSNLNYDNVNLYLLDDSSDEKFMKEADKLAETYKARVFRRQERHGAKAGIINDCVRTLSEKYVAVFDADQNPIPSFLSRIIPMLEKSEKLAFVQTPQFYSNMDASRVAYGSNMQQSVFYEYVCEAKSSSESMMCCGTNIVFRREALTDVGGLDETSVTEDFATSMSFHQKGWETMYYNHVSAFGQGPQNLEAYLKQQNRWAMGNIGVLRRLFREFIRRPRSLRLVQWFEYLTTASYYFIGWAYLFLVLCPILYVLFDVPSFFMHPVVYALTFVPYFLLSYGVFYRSMLGRRYKVNDLFKGQLLMFVSLPVYARAALAGVTGVRSSFQVTSKDDDTVIPYRRLWPQLLLWALNLAAIVWAVNRFMYETTAAIAINLVWLVYHFLLLSGVFYFNEKDSSVTDGAAAPVES